MSEREKANREEVKCKLTITHITRYIESCGVEEVRQDVSEMEDAKLYSVEVL